MGLLSGYLERRRQRESAVQPDIEPANPGLIAGEGVHSGRQPVADAGDWDESTEQGQGPGVAEILGILGMIKEASRSGHIQISHGTDHAVDLRGGMDAEELREQIAAALRERGIDPDANPNG